MREKSSARVNISSILYKGIKSTPYKGLNVMSQALLPVWLLCLFRKKNKKIKKEIWKILLSASELCHQKSTPKESRLVEINVYKA